jgi:putative transposase
LHFRETIRAARPANRKFVEEGMTMGSQPELTGGGLLRSAGGWSQVLPLRRKGHRQEGDERILGSGEFVHQVLAESEEKALRQLKLRKVGMSITHLIEAECRKHKVSRKEIEGGSRRAKVSRARAAIARRAMEDLGLSAAEVARHLGVNTSSIIRAAAKAGAEQAGDGYAT